MQLATQIPQDLKDKVDRELEPGERISWIGMPNPAFFTPKSKTMFLFAIPLTLFAVFWMCGAAGFKVPDFKEASSLFALFGLPFFFIGIGLLLSPLFAYYKSLKTVYVITNHRALTFEGGWKETIRSYPPSKLLNVYRKEKSNGTGDVIISFDEWLDSDGDRKTELLGFFRIREPKTVETMLHSLAKQAGVDVNITTPTFTNPKNLKGSFESSKTIINEAEMSKSESSTIMGKIIFVLALSCFLGYWYHSNTLQTY